KPLAGTDAASFRAFAAQCAGTETGSGLRAALATSLGGAVIIRTGLATPVSGDTAGTPGNPAGTAHRNPACCRLSCTGTGTATPACLAGTSCAAHNGQRCAPGSLCGYTAVVTGHTARPATATSATALAWRQARAASRRAMVAQPLVAAERGTLLPDRSPPRWRLLLAVPGQPATMVPAWFFLTT